MYEPCATALIHATGQPVGNPAIWAVARSAWVDQIRARDCLAPPRGLSCSHDQCAFASALDGASQLETQTLPARPDGPDDHTDPRCRGRGRLFQSFPPLRQTSSGAEPVALYRDSCIWNLLCCKSGAHSSLAAKEGREGFREPAQFVLRVVFSTFGTMILLENLGVSLTAVWTTLGIGSVAIALAL
jgi:hypothetical protein